MSCGISSSFPEVFPTSGQVTHVLLTRPPLDWRVAPPASFDLHVLSTPPAFILSQDQTLHLKVFARRPTRRRRGPQGPLLSYRSARRLMRVNPALVKDRKNSGFCENQEKDVWHALLSFQGTGSPRLDPADDAVPPAFSETGFPSKDGNFSLSDFPRSVKDLGRFRLEAYTNSHQDEGLKKNQDPCGGCAI
jgi:hypothetical protein